MCPALDFGSAHAPIGAAAPNRDMPGMLDARRLRN